MDSAAFGVEGKKEELPFEDAVLRRISRNQKYLWSGFLVVFALLVFCFIGFVWLAVEVANEDDDKDTNSASARQADSVLTLLSTARSAEGARPLFAGSGYWTDKEPLPYARSDHHVVAVDDLIYIIGGLNSSDNVVEDVTIYDTVLGTYSAGPPLPVPLHRFASAYDETHRRVYVFGGLSDPNSAAVKTVYVLNVDDQEWTEGPDLPAPRSDLCGAHVDGSIYAVGGYSLNFATTLDTVEALDVNDNEWKRVKRLPTPRGDCQAARLDDKLIVVGGYYDESGQWNADSFRAEVELYSPDSDEWEQRASLRNPRGDKAIAVLSTNRVLVVGGETHNRGSHTQVATHYVEEYLLSEDVWVDRAPLPDATFRAGAASVGGLVFVFGGHRTCDAPEGGAVSACIELDSLQVYFDVEHPNVFIV